MHADIQEALEQLNKSWKAFEHRGMRMTKAQVKKVLLYALAKGYKTTEELKDEEVDSLIFEPTTATRGTLKNKGCSLITS